MTENKCPYQSFKDKFSFFGGKASEEDSKPKESKCPFSSSEGPKVENIKNSEKPSNNEKKSDISDDEDDEKPQGGCPVINKAKKDPPNKHFEPSYEIKRYGPFDFIFELRGGLNFKDFLEQTENIRKYPRHLKYTLFNNDEKLKQIRKKEFPLVFFVYDDVKEKGSKLYKKRKFRESIDYYTYSYSMLKWLEFKEEKKNDEFLKSPSLDPVLDSEIKECKTFLDDVQVEDDSYRACVVYLLMCLSYSYMELRHYNDAIQCLDECLPICGDKVPDVYFRRSQARTYNKNSTDEELKLAEEDIEKALSLKNEKIYQEHRDILKKIVEDRKTQRKDKIVKLINSAEYSLNKIKERKMSIDQYFFNRGNDHVVQFKVLIEMKLKYDLAIKFFTETKNEEQLNIAYKEIESFLNVFHNFKFYFSFDAKNEEDLDLLSEDEKNKLKDEDLVKILNDYKIKYCSDIFGDGNYNFELYRYALEKVMDEERKLKEEEEKIANAESSKNRYAWFESVKNSNISYLFTVGIVLFTIMILASSYFNFSLPRNI